MLNKKIKSKSYPRHAKKDGNGIPPDMYDFSILRELRKREKLNIEKVSARSSVSPAVISKLERNQTRAELDTLFRLSRVFGMNVSDLLSLAEFHTANKARATEREDGGFQFQEISYANVRCLRVTGRAGQTVSRPEIHGDDYELCWVLRGAVQFTLPNEKHILKAGEAIQFDAILGHSYAVVEDCEMFLLHLKKPKRF